MPWTGVLDCLNAELLRRLPQMPYIAIVNIVCWCVLPFAPFAEGTYCFSRCFHAAARTYSPLVRTCHLGFVYITYLNLTCPAHFCLQILGI